MSKLRTAREIASLALERVGVFPAADSGEDPAQLARALDRLDMIVAELVGTRRALWLVRKTALVPLSSGVSDFDLIQQAAGAIKGGDLQFVIDVQLRYALTGDDQELERIDRRTYDAIANKQQPGPPERIYIDRVPLLPRVYVWPVPAVSTLSLAVTYQAYAPDVTNPDKKIVTGLEAAWQRWAEYQVAADIGSGPVVNLPETRLQDYRKEAAAAKRALLAFTARDGVYPPRTRYRDC